MNIHDVVNKGDKITQVECKKIGRPVKAVKNDKKVSAYVSEVEFQDLTELAEDSEISVSQYIRRLITNKLNDRK